jgi:hypothetical protein
VRENVKRVIEAAGRVQRGEADSKELEKAVDGLPAAHGAAAERLVYSDRMEDAVAEMHEGMRHFARDAGLKIGDESAERALLLGLLTMLEELVEAYACGGWRGRLEPYVAYWIEDGGWRGGRGRRVGRGGRLRGRFRLRRGCLGSGALATWPRLSALTCRLWRGLWLNTWIERVRVLPASGRWGGLCLRSSCGLF